MRVDGVKWRTSLRDGATGLSGDMCVLPFFFLEAERGEAQFLFGGLPLGGRGVVLKRALVSRVLVFGSMCNAFPAELTKTQPFSPNTHKALTRSNRGIWQTF